MKQRALITALFAAVLLTAGCTAKTALQDPRVYAQHGMEISRIASQMADTLYNTMYEHLAQQLVADGEVASRDRVKNVTMPQVAVTSFVDTDTYEAAGHLGRTLGEIFIHELSLRQVGVLEYKLTGSLAVGKQGEYVYSRDYKQLMQSVPLSHLLTGTMTRNADGVVLIARIVNLRTHEVIGSATGFIPYELLPYCYRTRASGCSLGNIAEYAVPGDKVASTRTANSTKANNSPMSSQAVSSSTAASPALSSRVYGPTSQGNYPQFKQEQNGPLGGDWYGGSADRVIYPAHSYLDEQRLVRVVHDESQYQRLRDC